MSRAGPAPAGLLFASMPGMTNRAVMGCDPKPSATDSGMQPPRSPATLTVPAEYVASSKLPPPSSTATGFVGGSLSGMSATQRNRSSFLGIPWSMLMGRPDKKAPMSMVGQQQQLRQAPLPDMPSGMESGDQPSSRRTSIGGLCVASSACLHRDWHADMLLPLQNPPQLLVMPVAGSDSMAAQLHQMWCVWG